MIRPDRATALMLKRLMSEGDSRMKAKMRASVRKAAEDLRADLERGLPEQVRGMTEPLEVKEVSGLQDDEFGFVVVGEPSEPSKAIPGEKFSGPAKEALSHEFGTGGKTKKSVWVPAVSRAVRSGKEALTSEWTPGGDEGSISVGDAKRLTPFQKALGLITGDKK